MSKSQSSVARKMRRPTGHSESVKKRVLKVVDGLGERTDQAPLVQVYEEMQLCSHHVRHGVMITLGYVQVLLDHMQQGEGGLAQIQVHMNGDTMTMSEVLQKVVANQQRIIQAIERVEG